MATQVRSIVTPSSLTTVRVGTGTFARMSIVGKASDSAAPMSHETPKIGSWLS